MKKTGILSLIVGIIAGTINPVFPQTTDFNLEAYKDFLFENKDMSPTQLLEMYPSGYFLDEVNVPYASALYFDSINAEYNLTADEKNLLGKNGFVVTERLRQPSFNDHFKVIYKKDLPVFISTDAILHAYHCSYDAILKVIEKDVLAGQLITLLTKMHTSLPDLLQLYDDQPQMQKMLQDVDVYLAVPLLLLDMDVRPYYASNEQVVDTLLGMIDQEDPKRYEFFADSCSRRIDFSQFTPRGHYTEDEILQQYFRAMMWLGRIEIYLDVPEPADQFGCSEEQRLEMVTRQAVDALLLIELLELSGADQEYQEMEEIISFFVGEQDNVTYPQLKSLKAELNYSRASALLDSLNLIRFQQTLSTKSFADQRIVSQIIYGDFTSPDDAKAAPAFMMFGQRFVIDSYITGNVVYDHILYQGRKQCRTYPSTLDILFAFGNDASSQLLIPELQEYKYSSNLAGLRYLVDQYGDDFWESSLYYLWLKAIKTLSPKDHADRDSLPSFMKTGAWGLEKMNTQLASWTELRHDNLLYAKQSYTTGGSCFYPAGYVEPIPEFYEVLNRTARIAKNKFQELNILTHRGDLLNEDSLVGYFNHLEYVTGMLKGIAEKELNSICLDREEIDFIKDLYITEGHQVGSLGYFPPTGWYPELFYFIGEVEKNDFLVADYHTAPTIACTDIPLGAVSHAGTGYIDLLINVVEQPEGPMMAFIGPVMSYHEYVTTNFQRLTDEEWKESYFQKSYRPEWVKGYLADKSGNHDASIWKLAASKQELEKMLGTDYTDPTDVPNIFEECPISIINAPNPFTEYTLISFTVPANLRNHTTRLSVYDLQGREINNLVHEILPPGHYMYRWDVNGSRGTIVPPGIYLVKIWVGNMDETLKVVLAK